jgi:N-acetylglucosaminyl-diphospho-decaprenol L-rhamnosyltransferase
MSQVSQKVTVLIVNYNSGRWLARCIATLQEGQAQPVHCRILDNASTDGSLAMLAPSPHCTIIKSEANLGFAVGVNQLSDGAQTPYLLILNPDCLLRPEGLLRLVEELEAHDEAAMVSGRVFNLDGGEQRGSRRRLPDPERILKELSGRYPGAGVDLIDQAPPTEPIEVEAVSGACMLVRTSVFHSLGGFDADYPMHFEDLDLMARIHQAGYRIRLLPDVAISHAGGISSHHRPLAVMRDKHDGLWLYLNKHCQDSWPAWSRPLWWLGIQLHRWALTPILWWQQRR